MAECRGRYEDEFIVQRAQYMWMKADQTSDCTSGQQVDRAVSKSLAAVKTILGWSIAVLMW